LLDRVVAPKASRPFVAGEVVEVPVEPNKPIKAGDVLLRIGSVPFEAQLKAVAASSDSRSFACRK
jgi:multidrug resistance efflux pump